MNNNQQNPNQKPTPGQQQKTPGKDQGRPGTPGGQGGAGGQNQRPFEKDQKR